MPKEAAIKYVVVEEGFSNRRVVFGPTTDKEAADRVASQHAARSVIQSKDR